MSITSSAVLTELNISVWTANKLDKGATESVLVNSNATVADAAQVRKNLMAGTSVRKKISDYAAGCRMWHNVRTLPWSDKGARLLPTSLFMDYKQEANLRRDTFNQMVDDFITNYPALVQTASNFMGNLFNPDDYPSAEEVRSKFGFRLVFSPVPESGDFRLDIPQQELDEVRKGYDDAFDTRVADAMRQPWEQLHRMLTGMSGKLAEPEGDAEIKRRWHDTFVTNAQELCTMLTHLNITGDPQLETARRQLEAAMLTTDIDVLKESEDSRADLKGRLDAILEGYSW
jgi:hypothetical protein